MKRLLGFGDVHFSAMNPWNIRAGENFLKWFDNQNFGPQEETESIWAGDIAEKDINPGIVIDQMHRLFNSCKKKFKHTYIVVGNHDKKLYHDVLQYSLMFLKHDPAFTVINKPQAITSTNNFKILALPHLHATETGSLSLSDYYTKYIAEQVPQNSDWDVVCGHWNIQESDSEGFMSDGVDISPLKGKVNCWMLGHIHKRVREEYLGSIWPNKYDEQDSPNPRGYKAYCDDGTYTNIPFPEFLHYENIKFGDEVPEQKTDCEYVYCITNCSSEILAKEKYPNINIRGIERKEQVDFSEVKSDETFDAFSIPFSEAYTKMRTELKVPISRGANTIIRQLLERKDGN